MTLRQLWQLIAAGKWTLLLCTVACVAGALAISLRLPKSYEAKARVILELVGADPVTGVMINQKSTESYIQTQQLLVASDRVTERVIDKLGWATNPAVEDAWQAQTGGVGDIRQWAAQRLAAEIGAYPLEGGGTLEIAYRAPDPDAAEAITRLIRESYIEIALALETEAASRRADRFAVLAAQGRVALTKAQAALATAQRETGTVLSAGRDIEGDRVDRLQGIAIALDQAAAHSAPQIATDRSLLTAQLHGKLIAVEQQIARAGDIAGGANPGYQALLDERAQLVGQIATAAAQQRAETARLMAAANAMSKVPEEQLAVAREDELDRAPGNLRVAQASRLVKLRRGELVRLEANLANARTLADRTESGLVVMGDVISNSNPVSPDIPLNLSLAAAFGLGLGLAWVMIDGLSRREVRGREDLAVATGVPVLAVLPRRRRAWWRRLTPRRRAAALA